MNDRQQNHHNFLLDLWAKLDFKISFTIETITPYIPGCNCAKCIFIVKANFLSFCKTISLQECVTDFINTIIYYGFFESLIYIKYFANNLSKFELKKNSLFIWFAYL
jgi:hypothetical protein